MSDIRKEIDHIDYTLIQLLSVRFNYVKAASKFKKVRQMFRPQSVLTVCWKSANSGLMSWD
ncbi:chorismate mutase [Snodgrassella sp.]|uniref:chorismate mutase n=1 Tax=Snodgrassella sp. TaxID=2815304 RepID=UPI00338DC613